jgi:hypothetical protein
MNMRPITCLVFWLFVAMGAFGQDSPKTLSVCDLFHNLDKWDGKEVRVKGLAMFRDGPELRFTILLPGLGEVCTFRNTAESAEIELEQPGDSILLDPANRGKKFDRNSTINAQAALKKLLTRKPNLKRALVTVDGIVSVREYRLSDIPPLLGGRVPRDIPLPITLTVERYVTVEAPPGS